MVYKQRRTLIIKLKQSETHDHTLYGYQGRGERLWDF